MFILCCSIALCLHKFEKRRQNYTYFHKPPNFFRIFFAFSVNFTQERIGYFAEFLYFCTRKHQEQSSSDGLANRAKRSHGGQYDAEAIVFTSKQNVMQQHIYYTKYALQFADMQIPELVTVFNAQVGNHGWSSMRSYHDQALIDEFQRRGIDVSAIYDGKSITFASPVRYDLPDNKLIAIG